MEQDTAQPYTLPPAIPGLTEADVVRIVNSMLTNLNTATKLSQGYIQSQNFVTGVSGWSLSSDSAEFNVGVSVQSINIPDTTTASSFHVDVSGNAWWGVNVATGYTGANAYILANGGAVFKNVQVGGTTVQYVITNSGIFSYGDSSDGTATLDGSTAVAGMSRSGSIYTMTRDVNFNNLTINAGVFLDPGGYRIFVQGTLTVNGTIYRNGNNAVGSTPGAALADGYLKGSPAGGTGGGGGAAGSNGAAGGNGTAAANSLGTTGFAGGRGGDAGLGVVLTGGAAGSAGAWSTVNVPLKIGVQLAQLLDVTATGATLKYNTSSGSGGGGGGAGGGGGSGQNGGDGGGAGSAGAMIAIYARNIVIGAAGVISANGGNGANGTNGTSGAAACGGGGSGGNGGIIILTYNQLTNSGSVTVTAGTKGIKGTGPFTTNATDGTNGSVGTIYQFQLSL